MKARYPFTNTPDVILRCCHVSVMASEIGNSLGVSFNSLLVAMHTAKLHYWPFVNPMAIS